MERKLLAEYEVKKKELDLEYFKQSYVASNDHYKLFFEITCRKKAADIEMAKWAVLDIEEILKSKNY